MKTIITLLALLLSACIAPAATYKDKSIDGFYFAATCTDHEHETPYACLVLFDGNKAKIVFRNGGYVIVTLHCSVISDIHNIGAYDELSGFFWNISLASSYEKL